LRWVKNETSRTLLGRLVRSKLGRGRTWHEASRSVPTLRSGRAVVAPSDWASLSGVRRGRSDSADPYRAAGRGALHNCACEPKPVSRFTACRDKLLTT